MPLTAAQRAAIAELLRQGYQAGQPVRPHEVFPARRCLARAGRRALEAVSVRFGLRRDPAWSTTFILTQAVLDAVQE